MSRLRRHNGIWKDAERYRKHNGVWKPVEERYRKVGAIWKEVGVSSFAKFFAGGRQGIWIDPSDLSTMFQDAAGTIPVTAHGQPVGRINDKSGRGNHLVQSTAANRPTYGTDGAKHWLQFDGFNDSLVASLPATLSVFSAVAGLASIGPNSEQHILGQYRSTGGARSWRFHRTNWPVDSWGGQYSPTGATWPTLGHTEDFSPMVYAMTSTGSGLSTYRNGEQVETTGAALNPNGSSNLHVGNGEGFNQPFNGRISSILVIDRVLSVEEMAEYTAYAMAGLAP